jgi:RNA exonuclease 4
MDTQTYIAMDCEMVGVGEGGRRSMLARVTLVNWNGEIVYDEFVKPTEEVTDYRTFVSGVTAESLDEASLDIQTVRRQVIQLLESKILVGHALKNDLHALNIHHLWQNTRDTAKYQPFQKVRFDDGILWPRKLKDLCLEHLGLDIQRPGQPHSSYQDAVAALALYKMVRPKWEKVMQYKIQKTAEIEAQQNRASVARTSVPVTLQLPQPVLPIASAA